MRGNGNQKLRGGGGQIETDLSKWGTLQSHEHCLFQHFDSIVLPCGTDAVTMK